MLAIAASLLACGSLLMGTLFLVLGLRLASQTEVTRRLREFVADPGATGRRMVTLSVRRAELAGSFRARVMLPWFRQIGRILARLTPTRLYDDLGRKLSMAGRPFGLGPREFYGLQLLFSLIGVWLALSILRGGLPAGTAGQDDSLRATAGFGSGFPSTGPSLPMRNLMGSALALTIFNYLPRTWLRRRVRARQDRIRRALPDALDMLSVCADAGLGFDQSLQRVSEQWKDPLAQEFGRVVGEMGMGVPRRTALRNLADRLDVPELASFVAVILQSDQLGMSITETLHAQANQMRIERRFQAQEQARKMPLKMLFPLLLFIFPAMFAVILGPMVPILADLFSMLRSAGR
jgi:tight adherence protein C